MKCGRGMRNASYLMISNSVATSTCNRATSSWNSDRTSAAAIGMPCNIVGPVSDHTEYDDPQITARAKAALRQVRGR